MRPPKINNGAVRVIRLKLNYGETQALIESWTLP